jgi:hypothetical protein
MNSTILAIAEELERIQTESPFLRIGQIISNASHPTDVFYVTDATLLDALRTTNNDGQLISEPLEKSQR